jgi:hypothetical protein
MTHLHQLSDGKIGLWGRANNRARDGFFRKSGRLLHGTDSRPRIRNSPETEGDEPMRPAGWIIAAAVIAAASGFLAAQPSKGSTMDELAERYVRLVLDVGQHDADFVDAYYGPKDWREAAGRTKQPLPALSARASDIAHALEMMAVPKDEMLRLRLEYLRRQTSAVRARLRMLQGERLTFDEESKALYDAVAANHSASHYESIVAQLEQRFPGEGPLVERFEAYRRRFVITTDRLDKVFRLAIEACRERTARHLRLPEGESFTVEYVTGKTWSGYNWYQGNFRSLIQVNTDLPIYIDRAVDLACHEGYPGHHVYNALLEKHLVRDRGWIEFTVYPLFSPQSLIAEGTANYGIAVAFPGEERVRFERDVLFPAAGLDPATAADYYDVQALTEKLAYAGNEAARQYLDGKIDAAAAASWLEKYALMARPRAEQRVRFMDQYRSYVINYNLGKDMVRDFVERHARGDANARWTAFGRLLSSPRLPSGLRD